VDRWARSTGRTLACIRPPGATKRPLPDAAAAALALSTASSGSVLEHPTGATVSARARLPPACDPVRTRTEAPLLWVRPGGGGVGRGLAKIRASTGDVATAWCTVGSPGQPSTSISNHTSHISTVGTRNSNVPSLLWVTLMHSDCEFQASVVMAFCFGVLWIWTCRYHSRRVIGQRDGKTRFSREMAKRGSRFSREIR
jgi:hypothetical protein